SMNATVPEEVIARAYEQDEAAAAAEYGALFRRDIESFVQREAVEACTISGRLEVPPALGVRYFGFCDPSGGSADDMTLANSQRCELLDHPKLAAQFLGLERRTARGGRDSIDHGPGAHDDLANAVAGSLLLAAAVCTAEPWGARLSPTPTRRVIDGETREPY